MPPTRFLHVANGTSTTGTIEAAGLPGARSIWADPLYAGPVPAGLSDRDLVDVRRRFLAGSADLASSWTGRDPSTDPVNDLREWRAAIARHEACDELVLWFEHDLFDQLNLIQLLTWIREHLPPGAPVSLISIDAFPGRPDFKGFGELTPSELATLFETRRPVSDRQFAAARLGWDAFRAPTPAALDEFRRGDTSSLPFLRDALTRFLQEYPWTTDGLSRTERRLLAIADAGAIALSKAFSRMYDDERVYHVTDGDLAALVDALSRTSPPLLLIDRTAGVSGHRLRGVVSLTATGRSVLAGARDRVSTCGIDRWLGGVHLQPGARVWRWDAAGERIIEDLSRV